MKKIPLHSSLNKISLINNKNKEKKVRTNSFNNKKISDKTNDPIKHSCSSLLHLKTSFKPTTSELKTLHEREITKPSKIKPKDIHFLPEQEVFRDKEALKDFVNQRTFEQEIKNDIEMSLQYINRYEKSDNNLEKRGIEMFTRALGLVGGGRLEIVPEQGEEIHTASENSLPSCTYLTHGGRVMLEIPQGEENNKIFNWLVTGNANDAAEINCWDQRQAVDKNQYVFNRIAATHGVERNKGERIEEKKGLLLGIKSVLKSTKTFKVGMKIHTLSGKDVTTDIKKTLNDLFSDINKVKYTHHYGIDLVVGVDASGKDKLGKSVKGPDGEHGHMYIFFKPATKDKPGAILIGIEGANPSSPNHSKLGKSSAFSPFYGCSIDKLRVKANTTLGINKEGKKSNKLIIPKKHGGRYIRLTEEKINAFSQLKIDPTKDAKKLVQGRPKESIEDFFNQ